MYRGNSVQDPVLNEICVSLSTDIQDVKFKASGMLAPNFNSYADR
jgi:hypothetical protein